tara:strand:- start:663 stop:860 length:198 start_codon:yes stop_codon:yes gene_type:complete
VPSSSFLLGVLNTVLLFAEPASAWNLRGVASSYESDEARQTRVSEEVMEEFVQEVTKDAIIGAME